MLAALPTLPAFVPSTPSLAPLAASAATYRSAAPAAIVDTPGRSFTETSAAPSAAPSNAAAAFASHKRGSSNSLGRTFMTFALLASSMLPLSPFAADLAAAEPPAVVAKQQQPQQQPLPTTSSIAEKAPSQQYLLFTGFPFPLGPFTERKTVETELVKGQVYSFEQELRLSGISANVRSTVFRMRDGHLLVYNPVAPTEEFLAQLAALDHKGVSHILLGATPYEHKVFVGPFARKFPEAKVWAVPDQWAWPLDLPGPLLGIDTKGSGGGELVDTATGSAAYASAPDLTAEFEVKLLRPPKRLGFGYAANEAALLHKDTKTLALTDALVNVPAAPTPVYDTGNLLAIGDNAKDSNSLGNLILKGAGAVNWQGTAKNDVSQLWADAAAAPGSTADALQRGWERNVLLSLYFGPSPRSLVDPDVSFQSLKNRWVVAPVTDSLIYRSERVKPELTRWVDDVAKWDFTLIAPSHFAAASGTAEDMRAAFKPTLAATTLQDAKASTERPYVKGDVKLLDDIAGSLIQLKII